MGAIPTWLVAALAVAGLLVLGPFAPWIVLALWLGLYARRIHAPLTRRLGGRSGLAATLTISLLLVVAIPVGAVLTSIVLDAIALVQRLMESDQARAVFEKLVQGGTPSPSELDPQQAKDSIGSTTSSAIDLLLNQGDRALAIMRQVAGAAAHFVIGMLIVVTGIYGVLVSGPAWWAWCEHHLPIAPAHLRAFAAAFVETGRGLWFGIVGAGTIQSVVATITYLALGVPSALALGMLTLLLSVIPAIGTALVWVPVAAGLAITGRTAAAIVLAVVGVAVIGTVDNVARPFLARKGRLELPTWLVLIGMFGGIELIGGWGLLLGPLALRLAKEALVLRARSPLVVPPDGVASSGAVATSGEPVARTDAS